MMRLIRQFQPCTMLCGCYQQILTLYAAVQDATSRFQPCTMLCRMLPADSNLVRCCVGCYQQIPTLYDAVQDATSRFRPCTMLCRMLPADSNLVRLCRMLPADSDLVRCCVGCYQQIPTLYDYNDDAYSVQVTLRPNGDIVFVYVEVQPVLTHAALYDHEPVAGISGNLHEILSSIVFFFLGNPQKKFRHQWPGH